MVAVLSDRFVHVALWVWAQGLLWERVVRGSIVVTIVPQTGSASAPTRPPRQRIRRASFEIRFRACSSWAAPKRIDSLDLDGGLKMH